MTIPLTFRPDLEADGVYAFLWSQDAHYPERELAVDAGYVLAEPKRGRQSIGRTDIKIHVVTRQHYTVYERTHVGTGSKIGSFSVLVPIVHTVTLAAVRNLLINSRISPEDSERILSAYAAYSYPADGDPNLYVALQMGSAQVGDEFKIEYTYALTKVSSTPDTAALDAALAVYNGNAGGTLYTRSGPIEAASFFAQSFEVRLTGTDRLTPAECTTPPLPSEHFVNTDNGATVDQFIEARVQREWREACGKPGVSVKLDIAAFGHIPEFMFRLEMEDYRIGCMVVSIPVLRKYSRVSTLVVFAYVGVPAKLALPSLATVERCAWKSAFNVTVLGMALIDLGAAILAFIALFKECVSYNEGGLDCLVPSLGIEHRTGPWMIVWN